MNNITVTRTAYGQIVCNIQTAHLLNAAHALCEAAKGKLPPAYDDREWGCRGRERNKLIGTVVYREIYDVTPSGRQALVCVSTVVGCKFSREYFVLTRCGRGVRVTPANKVVVRKAVKSAERFGDVIDVVQGRVKLSSMSARIRTGYKLLVRTDTPGVYQSAWDGSDWAIGRARIERATDDHTGGYYYYASIVEALAAAAAGDVFGGARKHGRLAVVEVEASGRHYRHTAAIGTKLCATKIRPIRGIASTMPMVA